MAENSHISWADHTFNPWIGCTKISPACDGCYAAHLMGGGRYSRAVWGEPGKGEGTRARTAPSNWAKVRSWNRKAADVPGKTFVFCSSLADVFDNAVPAEWRRDLFDLIRETPNLTWLLLTKRPGMIQKLYDQAEFLGLQEEMGEAPRGWPRNAAIGCTVVNQEEADRDVPKLLAAKAALNPAFAFLSMEPLLGPVDLDTIYLRRDGGRPTELSRRLGDFILPLRGAFTDSPRLDWVITGGETDQGSHKSRPADPAWYRSLRDQCAAAGVTYHHKQNGEWCEFGERGQLSDGSLNLLGKPDNAPHGWAKFGDGDGCRIVTRVGKDRAGRLLDGVTHNARPVG